MITKQWAVCLATHRQVAFDEILLNRCSSGTTTSWERDIFGEIGNLCSRFEPPLFSSEFDEIFSVLEESSERYTRSVSYSEQQYWAYCSAYSYSEDIIKYISEREGEKNDCEFSCWKEAIYTAEALTNLIEHEIERTENISRFNWDKRE